VCQTVFNISSHLDTTLQIQTFLCIYPLVCSNHPIIISYLTKNKQSKNKQSRAYFQNFTAVLAKSVHWNIEISALGNTLKDNTVDYWCSKYIKSLEVQWKMSFIPLQTTFLCFENGNYAAWTEPARDSILFILQEMTENLCSQLHHHLISHWPQSGMHKLRLLV